MLLDIVVELTASLLFRLLRETFAPCYVFLKEENQTVSESAQGVNCWDFGEVVSRGVFS